MDNKNNNSDQDKDKMKQVILDNLKRLALLNMSLFDLADLYNKKLATSTGGYNTCDKCVRLSSNLTCKLSKYSYDSFGNYYHYNYCVDCCKNN